MRGILEKQKRGQQEVIVTVLLVLIALAAVAAIAYFIVKNVRQSASGADLNAQCLTAGDFEITATTASTVSIQRGMTSASTIALANPPVQINVNGVAATNVTCTPTLNSGVTTICSGVTIASGNNVTVLPRLAQDSFVCPVAASKTA